MIKNIKFKNFRKFSKECQLDFFDKNKNEVNNLIGVAGFSSSGKSTVLSFCDFIPVLWNLKFHFSQFVKTNVLNIILKDYKDKNINFLEKYKNPLAFQQSDEFKNKYNELINSKEMSKTFLQCNLFKLNLYNKKAPLVSEVSYLLSNNDYLLHKLTLDLKENKVTEVFLLNGDQVIEKNDSIVSEFESKIQSVFKQYNEKPVLFMNLSNLSKSRLSNDEQNRRHFGTPIQPKHQKLFKLFINLFDPNISEINYNNNIPISYVVGDEREIISFNDLSTGTRKAIYLWSQIYVALILKINNNKYFFVYDEIQDNWNLALIDLIFYIFKNKALNSNNCQLLFSTHNPIIMENFKNTQIFLIDKSGINRADNINIKNNFAKAYLYEKIIKNDYKTTLDDFIKELSKI